MYALLIAVAAMIGITIYGSCSADEDYGEYVTKVRTVEDDSGNTPIGIKFTFLVVCFFSLSHTHSSSYSYTHSLVFSSFLLYCRPKLVLRLILNNTSSMLQSHTSA